MIFVKKIEKNNNAGSEGLGIITNQSIELF